jgi:hypothetical protein
VVVRKIQIGATAMLGDTDIGRPQGGVELSPGFEQIEGRPGRLIGWGLAGGFIKLAPQPGPKPGTANGPGFSVPVDHDIRKRGAVGRVKQLCADCQGGKQIGRH